MLHLSKQWGLDPNEVKNHLLGNQWDVGLDLPALLKHLDGIQSGMWTHLPLSPGSVVLMWSLLGDAGYEVQLVNMHGAEELYVRRPLEEA